MSPVILRVITLLWTILTVRAHLGSSIWPQVILQHAVLLPLSECFSACILVFSFVCSEHLLVYVNILCTLLFCRAISLVLLSWTSSLLQISKFNCMFRHSKMKTMTMIFFLLFHPNPARWSWGSLEQSVEIFWQKVWKLINIWWSYKAYKMCQFFGRGYPV